MTASQPTADFPLMRAASALASVGVVAVAIAVAVIALVGAFAQIIPALSTAAVCIIASLVAQLPVYWRAPAAPEGAAQGFLIGMVLRMVVCLGAVIALAAATKLPLTPLALWMLMWYLLLLVVEVTLLVRYLRRREDSAPPRTEDAV